MIYNEETGTLIDNDGHKWNSIFEKQLEYTRFLSIYDKKLEDKDPQIETLKEYIGNYPSVIYDICKLFKKRF